MREGDTLGWSGRQEEPGGGGGGGVSVWYWQKTPVAGALAVSHSLTAQLRHQQQQQQVVMQQVPAKTGCMEL